METFEESTPRVETEDNKPSRDELQIAALNEIIEAYADIPAEARRRTEAHFAAQ